jgi:hypothetical protein
LPAERRLVSHMNKASDRQAIDPGFYAAWQPVNLFLQQALAQGKELVVMPPRPPEGITSRRTIDIGAICLTAAATSVRPTVASTTKPVLSRFRWTKVLLIPTPTSSSLSLTWC